MHIVKTLDEVYSFLDSTTTLGWISIQRKSSVSKLHAGHEYVVNYSKANFDITAVNFWEAEEGMHYIYKSDIFENTYGQPWDSTGCIDWCEQKGVDIVMIPDSGYTQEYLIDAGINIDSTGFEIYNWVEDLWNDRNYEAYEPTLDDASRFSQTTRAKTIAILQYAEREKQIYKNRISTWKDGSYKFIVADFIHNFLPVTDDFIMLEPIKAPDGVYYSSSYNEYSEAEKNAIVQIPTIVDSVGYDDTTALIVALNAMGESVGLNVYRVDVVIGGVVGENNDFIEVFYNIDTKLDSYPILKEGVR